MELTDYKSYQEFIEEKKKRLDLDFTGEWHHILPKSMGGTDDESNFVYLTIFEHVYAHYLLAKESKQGAAIFYNAFNLLTQKLSKLEKIKIEELEDVALIREKGQKALQGLVFWNNGKINIRAYEAPDSSWKRGMISNRAGYSWYHNPDTGESKQFYDIKDVPEGWECGTGYSNVQGMHWYHNKFTGEECMCLKSPGKDWEEGMSHKQWINSANWWNNGKEELLAVEKPSDDWKLGRLPYVNYNDGERTYRGSFVPDGYYPGKVTSQASLVYWKLKSLLEFQEDAKNNNLTVFDYYQSKTYEELKKYGYPEIMGKEFCERFGIPYNSLKLSQDEVTTNSHFIHVYNPKTGENRRIYNDDRIPDGFVIGKLCCRENGYNIFNTITSEWRMAFELPDDNWIYVANFKYVDNILKILNISSESNELY